MEFIPFLAVVSDGIKRSICKRKFSPLSFLMKNSASVDPDVLSNALSQVFGYSDDM